LESIGQSVQVDEPAQGTLELHEKESTRRVPDRLVGREKGTHDLRSAALRASFRAVICLMLCATGLGIAQNTNPG